MKGVVSEIALFVFFSIAIASIARCERDTEVARQRRYTVIDSLKIVEISNIEKSSEIGNETN